ncbi:alpha/beta fold hydrolase [Streptomyces sp. NPDC059340]|uniref:alpha/beta fold hydrolase n=1 Tax=Streptomyces sp. NPDC059340 TaxID=3346806 RepID=UPI00369917F8
MDIEQSDLMAGGMTFRCRAAGPRNGRLVLLLHGFPQTSRVWDATLAALAEDGLRAVAFDQRGYSPGARPDSVDAYAIKHLAGDVLAVARELGADTFHLVGHDWGGIVAWQIAGLHPDVLDSLTVVSTPHPTSFKAALHGELGGDQPQRSAYADFLRQPDVAEDFLLASDAAGLRGLYSESPAEQVADYLAVLCDRRALTASLNYYRATAFDEQPHVSSIQVPTLYVWSTEDEFLGKEAARATAQHVAAPMTYVELEGVSHWIPDTAAAQFNALLQQHIRTAGAPDPT